MKPFEKEARELVILVGLPSVDSIEVIRDALADAYKQGWEDARKAAIRAIEYKEPKP